MILKKKMNKFKKFHSFKGFLLKLNLSKNLLLKISKFQNTKFFFFFKKIIFFLKKINNFQYISIIIFKVFS